MLIGLTAYLLHEKFFKTNLPDFLEFFGGSRFVPIICAVSSIFLGAAMYFIRPHFQAFGSHHIFYLPFWTTAPGGSEIVNGQLTEGAQRIFFAELGDPNVEKFFEGTSRFISGRFITMMFGLIGAAFAMYKTAKPQKKIVGGMLLPATLTSFLTRMTEPLEFSLLFVASPLYVLHAFMLAHIFQITIGKHFRAG